MAIQARTLTFIGSPDYGRKPKFLNVGKRDNVWRAASEIEAIVHHLNRTYLAYRKNSPIALAARESGGAARPGGDFCMISMSDPLTEREIPAGRTLPKATHQPHEHQHNAGLAAQPFVPRVYSYFRNGSLLPSFAIGYMDETGTTWYCQDDLACWKHLR